MGFWGRCKRTQAGRLLPANYGWSQIHLRQGEFIFGISRGTINKTRWQRQTATPISPNIGQAISVARALGIDKHPLRAPPLLQQQTT